MQIKTRTRIGPERPIAYSIWGQGFVGMGATAATITQITMGRWGESCYFAQLIKLIKDWCVNVLIFGFVWLLWGTQDTGELPERVGQPDCQVLRVCLHCLFCFLNNFNEQSFLLCFASQSSNNLVNLVSAIINVTYSSLIPSIWDNEFHH